MTVAESRPKLLIAKVMIVLLGRLLLGWMILHALACAGGDDVLALSLPDLGTARSMILLVEDGQHQNPFVVLTDVPFAPLHLEGELLSLEDAQVEVALYSCPLAGLGLEAGRGRPGPRDAEGLAAPIPPAAFHATFQDGKTAGHSRLPNGTAPARIQGRALGIQVDRACPRAELQRVPLGDELGNLRLLGSFGPDRAVMQFEDGTFGVVDADGPRYLDSPFGENRLWASTTLPDGRVVVTGEGGRAAWLGTLETGFEPIPPLLDGPGLRINLAAPLEPSEPLELMALRWDSLQRFDGTSWTVSSSLTHQLPENPRIPSIAYVGPDELLFVHPDSRGVFRFRQGLLSEEPIIFQEPDKRSAVAAFHSSYGGIVGGEDTSVRVQDETGTWVELTPPLSRGQVRFIVEVGRAVVISDGQGTLHVRDPTIEFTCAELPASGAALGFGVTLREGLIAVGSEVHRSEPVISLVSFENIMPRCDLSVESE